MNKIVPLKIRFYKSIPKKYTELVNTLKKEAFAAEYKMTAKQIEKHQDQFCSQLDIIQFLIVFDHQEVVGGLKIMKRLLNYRGKELILGGLAGVWTRIDLQKKGIGQTMVKEAMNFLHGQKCDVAYLCTNIEKLGSFYKKAGFSVLNKKYTFISQSDKRFYETDGMIAPIKSVELFREIIHDKKPFDIGRGNW